MQTPRKGSRNRNPQPSCCEVALTTAPLCHIETHFISLSVTAAPKVAACWRLSKMFRGKSGVVPSNSNGIFLFVDLHSSAFPQMALHSPQMKHPLPFNSVQWVSHI